MTNPEATKQPRDETPIEAARRRIANLYRQKGLPIELSGVNKDGNARVRFDLAYAETPADGPKVETPLAADQVWDAVMADPLDPRNLPQITSSIPLAGTDRPHMSSGIYIRQ